MLVLILELIIMNLKKIYKSFDEMISSKVKSKEEYVSYDLFGLKVKKEFFLITVEKNIVRICKGILREMERYLVFLIINM